MTGSPIVFLRFVFFVCFDSYNLQIMSGCYHVLSQSDEEEGEHSLKPVSKLR